MIVNKGKIQAVLEALPALEEPSPFTIPLIHMLPEPLMVVEKINGTINNERSYDLGLFADISEQQYLNVCAANGIVPNVETKRPVKLISESGLSPLEGVKTFCKRTPFEQFLLTPVPLKFDYETRFSHVHVVGG